MATDTKLVVGLALDALIAEQVMGWPRLEDGNFVQPDGWRRGLDVEEWEEDRGSFHPSTDIAAAWEVVEKLTKQGVNCQDGTIGQCELLVSDNYYQVRFEGVEAMHGADTMPLAICLAALISVGYHAD